MVAAGRMVGVACGFGMSYHLSLVSHDSRVAAMAGAGLLTVLGHCLCAVLNGGDVDYSVTDCPGDLPGSGDRNLLTGLDRHRVANGRGHVFLRGRVGDGRGRMDPGVNWGMVGLVSTMVTMPLPVAVTVAVVRIRLSLSIGFSFSFLLVVSAMMGSSVVRGGKGNGLGHSLLHQARAVVHYCRGVVGNL